MRAVPLALALLTACSSTTADVPDGPRHGSESTGRAWDAMEPFIEAHARRGREAPEESTPGIAPLLTPSDAPPEIHAGPIGAPSDADFEARLVEWVGEERLDTALGRTEATFGSSMEAPWTHLDLWAWVLARNPALASKRADFEASLGDFDVVRAMESARSALRPGTKLQHHVGGPGMAPGSRQPQESLTPGPGPLSLRSSLAALGAEVAFAEWRRSVAEQLADASAAAARWRAIEEELLALDSQLELLAELEDLARRGIETGRSGPAHLLGVTSRHERVEARRVALRARLEAPRATLEAQLALPGSGNGSPTIPLPPRSDPLDALAFDWIPWVGDGAAETPAVQAARARLARQDRVVEMTRTALDIGRGGVGLGASHIERGMAGEGGIARPAMPDGSRGIPSGPRLDVRDADRAVLEASLHEQLERRRALAEMSESVRLMTLRSVRSAHAELEAAWALERALEDRIVPAEEARVGALRDAFVAGRSDFDAVLEGVERLERIQVELAHARRDVDLAHSRMLRALGQPTPREGAQPR